VIIVQCLEQVGAPHAEALTNEQKKARAQAVMRRWWPDADVNDLDIAIEAAVNGVKMLKRLGVKLPQPQLTGEEQVNDLLGGFKGSVQPTLPQQPGTGSF
jgi:hypothetical protein